MLKDQISSHPSLHSSSGTLQPMLRTGFPAELCFSRISFSTSFSVLDTIKTSFTTLASASVSLLSELIMSGGQFSGSVSHVGLSHHSLADTPTLPLLLPRSAGFLSEGICLHNVCNHHGPFPMQCHTTI